jgi:hypothetical protein
MECSSKGIATRGGGDILGYTIVICLSFFGTVILWVVSDDVIPYINKKFSIRWSILFDWLHKDFTLCKKKKSKIS